MACKSRHNIGQLLKCLQDLTVVIRIVNCRVFSNRLFFTTFDVHAIIISLLNYSDVILIFTVIIKLRYRAS